LHEGNLSGKFNHCSEDYYLSMVFTAWFYVKGIENWHFVAKNDMLFMQNGHF